jgi:hypothetical protein
MLAGDPMEAAEQAQEFLKKNTLVTYYEDVLVEGLKLAQADAQAGLLVDELMTRVRDAVAEIVDDLGAHEDKPELVKEEAEAAPKEQAPLAQINKAEDTLNQNAAEVPVEWRTPKPVLCIPGLSVLDEAVALMIAQLVEKQGIGARVEKADALSVSRIFSLDTKDIALICVCYVENATPAQIHYAIRRLRRKAPRAAILVSLVGSAHDITNSNGGQAAVSDVVERSLSATVARIVAAANGTDPDASDVLPKPDDSNIASLVPDPPNKKNISSPAEHVRTRMEP